MHGPRHEDVLFLQAKEAEASVFERFTKIARMGNHGARVVAGQRLMQASSDILLGWQRSVGLDGVSRDYYVRQLQDWKGSIDTENAIPEGLKVYSELCAHTLARAHAVSGDRIAIVAYLGNNRLSFEKALARFAESWPSRRERAGRPGVRRRLQERPASRRRRNLRRGWVRVPESGSGARIMTFCPIARPVALRW